MNRLHSLLRRLERQYYCELLKQNKIIYQNNGKLLMTL